jgi:hypothetical protein
MSNLDYKKIFTVFFLLVFSVCALAQTPQYYNTTAAGIGNTIPFGSAAASGYMSQYLMLANEYGQPSPAPAGNITKFYIYMNTAGTGTYAQFTIKMGQSAITVFPTGTQYTGQLDTVYYRASGTFTSSGASTWMMITLDRPFTYNPAQSLIIQISHCGLTGTGMSVWQQAGATGVFRRNNITGTTSCVFTYSGQDSRILQCGVDISSAAPVVNRTLKLATPGVNTTYVQVPFVASMVGFGNNITIEAWIKPGGTTTAATVLNKGVASFDYQLGVSLTTMLPFFRAGSTIATCPFPITANVWQHLAAVSNGSTVTFYLNGVPGTPVTAACVLGSSTNEMRIARGNSDAGSGWLDEIRVWSVARTGAEINNNKCNKWIPNNTAGLKAQWHFDSTYVDSVSGWNGVPMGTAGFDTMSFCPIVTNISGNEPNVPASYKLGQNYPNPFNPVTTIKFSIPKSGYVEIKLYDVLGKEVATLVSDPYNAGEYRVDFNASNLPSGTYFYRLESNGFIDTKKMILIK